MLVVADAGTPYSLVSVVLNTAWQVGIRAYDFALAPERFANAVLPTVAPGPRRDEQPPVMTMALSAEGVTLAGSAHEGEPVAHPAGSTEAIEAYAKALREAAPPARRVFVSAAPEVELGTLLAALSAARGSACGAEDEGCWLPEVALLSESAHGYEGRELRDVALFRGPPYPKEMWEGSLSEEELDEALRVGGLGGASTPEPGAKVSVVVGKPKVSGALDADIIRRVLKAHVGELASCYAPRLATNSKLRGRVEFEFMITGQGKVGTGASAWTNMDDAKLSKCLVGKIEALKFPKPRGGGIATVEVSAQFKPG